MLPVMAFFLLYLLGTANITLLIYCLSFVLLPPFSLVLLPRIKLRAKERKTKATRFMTFFSNMNKKAISREMLVIVTPAV